MRWRDRRSRYLRLVSLELILGQKLTIFITMFAVFPATVLASSYKYRASAVLDSAAAFEMRGHNDAD